MTTQRPKRVQEALLREISNIIHNELRDPRISFMTSITNVELTKDLRYARVYFSVLGNEKDRIDVQKGLDSAKGFIKRLLGQRIKLRFATELVFKFDTSIAYADHINEVLGNIEKEKPDEDSNKKSN